MVHIYEYIRTRGCEPLHFEEHYRHLEELAQKFRLYTSGLNISREEIYNLIVDKLKAGGYSSTATNAVCVIVPPYSKPYIEIEEIFYDSFALRAMHPKGFIYYIGGYLETENTSARRTLLAFNRLEAQVADEGVAIWIQERSNEVIAIDGASVVAVFEDEIRFSKQSNSLEFDLAYEKVSKVRKNVTRGTILEEDLLRAKEVLGIDHRGIVALDLFEGRQYTDITAEKIAEIMSEEE